MKHKKQQWLRSCAEGDYACADGLVPVNGYKRQGRPPEEVAVIEKARDAYRADAVFFQVPPDGGAPVAQAFIYRSDGSCDDPAFARLHRQLWCWGGVPLVYRVTNGLVQLYRCAHGPDFEHGSDVVCNPFDTLRLAGEIANDPWWDGDRLRSGTLWDDPDVCVKLLSGRQAAQKTLIQSVQALYRELQSKRILNDALRRKLLVLCILITYLEERKVFEDGFFAQFHNRASSFFDVLGDGAALLKLLDHLEKRFNGNVFALSEEDRQVLETSRHLGRFADLVEGKQEPGGQRTLWRRYSFADLPVELISHIYQLFVQDADVAVYTPHFVVRLMLGEVLSWDRLDRLEKNDEVILDPACGSGVFLVEAYKRLILHWRYRHDWQHPGVHELKLLLQKRIRGVDLENGAVELASFSLCLALCDALEPGEIRHSIKLFPPLMDKTIHAGCFFDVCEHGLAGERIGVVVGNPPFASRLATPGARRAYEHYQAEYGALPDKQVAYLFLHDAMRILAPGGVLCMLQQYNFLYNQKSQPFRQSFITRWDVREILDFISVRGLFQKGGADTKVVVVLAEAQTPPADRKILHATFRRSGRTDAGQGFDIDYYDMHWLPRDLARSDDRVWRSNLLGGGRVLAFVDRMSKCRTLGHLTKQSGWSVGEGWIKGNPQDGQPAEHVIGAHCVAAESLHDGELAPNDFSPVPEQPIQWPRREQIYQPPLLLIRKHEDLAFGVWDKNYLTYQHTVMGFSAFSGDQVALKQASGFLVKHKRILQALIAVTGSSSLVSKATAILSADILALPFPENDALELSPPEQILVDDILDYYRELIRLGDKSTAMKALADNSALDAFNSVLTERINGIYHRKKLRVLAPQRWSGILCQPYVFGNGKADWTDAGSLRGKLNALLHEKRGGGLQVTRIARIYDGNFIYLLKPDRLRYWLRSIALRDGDEILADLAAQGF